MNKAIIFAFAAIMLLVIFVFGSVLFMDKQEQEKVAKVQSVTKQDTDVFVRDYSQTMGSANAKVVISEFLDPGCETCRAFHPFMKDMMKAWPGKLKLVIRYAPLHEGADTMIKILEAAKIQGKYWEALDVMYEKQPLWASHSHPQPDQIWQFLPAIGLDVDKLRQDMLSPEIAKNIQQDIADGKALNVRQTPEFFVNGRPLLSFGYKQLQTLIESEIMKQYKGASSASQK